MMMMNEHTTRKRGRRQRERAKAQELLGAAMARERGECTARDIGERKGENCNIVMIFYEI
jgi:hypothetical protein